MNLCLENISNNINTLLTDMYSEQSLKDETLEKILTDFDNDVEKDCNYLYHWGGNDYSNKYKYDRWITSIIFSVLIIASELGIILFGFLLFKE